MNTSPASEKRFHRDAYGLPSIANLIGTVGYKLTRHAAERISEKRIAVSPAALATLDASWKVFEVATTAGRVTKVAARRALGNGFDVCAVFATDTKSVVTVWANRSNDSHRTLDRSLYCRP